MANKVLVYMVDGVAAEHYNVSSKRFPNFTALEERGFRIKNLQSVALGTSLPGRTGMLTGVTADVSSVYGNRIWDGSEFRYSNPDDIQVPTIPQLAKAQGLNVASLGAGMIRYEDTHTTRPPWWIMGDMVQRARDAAPESGGDSWVNVARAPITDDFKAACEAFNIPTDYDELPTDTHPFLRAIVHDQRIADWVSAMVVSADAPDLIWAEFLATDVIQHYAGYKSAMAQASVAQADMALGKILQRMQQAGVLDTWNIAVMSDHGHSEVTTCIYPQVVIPDAKFACEGGSLLVATSDEAELQRITEALAKYDAEPFPNDCVPEQWRSEVHVFVAPPKFSFEDAPEGVTDPTGTPKAISTHGLKPGMTGDDRFALFAGPDVPHGMVENAPATQIAPTLAKLLNLTDGNHPDSAVF